MTDPKTQEPFLPAFKQNEGSYKRFLRYLADVNQAENKKQHHDLFYMKWNFALLLNLNKKRKIQIHVGSFLPRIFLFFIALSFMFFTFFTLKLHFSEILMTRYLAVSFESHWKANNNMTVRAILNRLLQLTPRTKTVSIFKTLTRFFYK